MPGENHIQPPRVAARVGHLGSHKGSHLMFGLVLEAMLGPQGFSDTNMLVFLSHHNVHSPQLITYIYFSEYATIDHCFLLPCICLSLFSVNTVHL